MAKTKVNLVYDGDALTVEDILVLEDGSMRDRMGVLARFIQNGKGEFLDPDTGMEKLKKLSVNQLNEATRAFAESAKDSVDPK